MKRAVASRHTDRTRRPPSTLGTEHVFTRSIAIILHGSQLEREGLTSILQLRERFAATLEAASLEEALAISCVSVALILVDLALPSLRGGAGLSLLRHQFPAARVVGVSSGRQVQADLEALDQAHGVICNRLTQEEVRRAVDDVLLGATFKPPCVSEAECGARNSQSFLDKYEITPRQRDVFRLFRKGFSDAEIGAALEISEATVRYHLNAACKKMGLPNRIAAARFDLPTEPGNDG